MLRVFRVRAYCLVTAVLLAVGTTTAAFDELLHAGGTHDAACLEAADVAHDASSHRFQSADDGAGGDGHCVACHFARASRLGAQSASHGAATDEGRTPRPAHTTTWVASAALDNLPPRSPPGLA